MLIEGALDVSYGELAAGGVHEVGFIVNPNGTRGTEYVLRDDIEVTNAAHTNRNGAPYDFDTSNPGATVLRAWGDAVKNHGVVPEMYALLVAATVPAEKLAEYDAKPLDPFFDPENPYEEILAMIRRLAGDNGITDLNQVEVALMDRSSEDAILSALQRIQGEVAPELTITRLSDGSVDPAELAMARRKEGKYLIALVKAKSGEGTKNFFESGAMNAKKIPRGAVVGMRYVSKNTNNLSITDEGEAAKGPDGKSLLAHTHRNRLRWSRKEEAALRALRPQDAKAILNGTKLYTQADARELGDVEIAVTYLTDNPWFNLPGPQLLEDKDTVRVVTTRLSTKAAREQGADLWVEVDDVSRLAVEAQVAHTILESGEPSFQHVDFSSVFPGQQVGAVFENLLAKEIGDFSMPLSPGVLKSKQVGTIAVYESALDNLTIARQVELLAAALKRSNSGIGFSLISTSGNTEHGIVQGVLKDSKGTVDLNGAFRTTLVVGQVDVFDPIAVADELAEAGYPLLELVAPADVIQAYRAADVRLYAWLVSRNPEEGETGIANGAGALREMVNLLGLTETERVALLRNGGREFTVVVQPVGQELEEFDRFYQANRGV